MFNKNAIKRVENSNLWPASYIQLMHELSHGNFWKELIAGWTRLAIDLIEQVTHKKLPQAKIQFLDFFLILLLFSLNNSVKSKLVSKYQNLNLNLEFVQSACQALQNLVSCWTKKYKTLVKMSYERQAQLRKLNN